MKHHTPVVALGLIAILAIGAAGPAAAHETQSVEGYEVTFGGTDEPVITGERMWLQFEIVDAETGEPAEGQAETLQVSIQKRGGEKVALDVGESHGEPGVYEAAVVFTEPGDYIAHLEGSVEGTEIHMHFEKEVHDHTELEYPGDGAELDEAGDESESDGDEHNSHDHDGDDSQADDADDRATQSGFGTGIAAAALGVLAVLGAVLLGLRR